MNSLAVSSAAVCFLFCWCLLLSQSQSSAEHNSLLSIKVDLDSPLAFCDPKFLSIAIDSGLVRYHFSGFDYGSPKLQNLAKALTPCDFRLGGTNADFLVFDPDGEVPQSNLNTKDVFSSLVHDTLLNDGSSYQHAPKGIGKLLTNFTMTGKEWDRMVKFFSQVGWSVMFDFNLFRWKNGLWDPRNAEELLKYSALRGYDLQAFQLGNEPNSFHYNFNFSIPAATLVQDFTILKDILYQYPQYYKNKLYGPDVTDLYKHSSSRQYLQDFVTAGGDLVVDEISLHHYYLNGRLAKAEDFYSIPVMEKLRYEIDWGLTFAKGTPIRLTETSSCYGGGAPGLSDAYVAGFLWLDKLGMAAQYGVTRVFRQSFYGGSYALLSSKLDPNPDYFLSVLHKRLIQGPVFNATVTPKTPQLRIYAHCTRELGEYKKGALTLAFLNTRNESLAVTLSQFSSLPVDLYILTPGDSAGLKSRFVRLNGEVLKMSGASLPDFNPKPYKGDIGLPPLSFGFIVVPDAKIAHCMK